MSCCFICSFHGSPLRLAANSSSQGGWSLWYTLIYLSIPSVPKAYDIKFCASAASCLQSLIFKLFLRSKHTKPYTILRCIWSMGSNFNIVLLGSVKWLTSLASTRSLNLFKRSFSSFCFFSHSSFLSIKQCYKIDRQVH